MNLIPQVSPLAKNMSPSQRSADLSPKVYQFFCGLLIKNIFSVNLVFLANQKNFNFNNKRLKIEDWGNDSK